MSKGVIRGARLVLPINPRSRSLSMNYVKGPGPLINTPVVDSFRTVLVSSFEDRVCWVIEKRTDRAHIGTVSLLCETTAPESHFPSLNSIRAYDRMRDGRKIPTYCLDCQEENS